MSFVLPAGRRSIQREQLGKAAGEGLTKMFNAYSMNKSLNEAMNDSQYKNGTPYERADILQRSLFGHGPEGQQFLQERMQLEGRRNFENALEKARKLANDPKASNMDIMLALAETGVDGKQLQTFYQAILENRAQQTRTKEKLGGDKSFETSRLGKGGNGQQELNIPPQDLQQTPNPTSQPPIQRDSTSQPPIQRDSTLQPPKFGQGPKPVLYTNKQWDDAYDRDRKANLLGDPRGELAQMEYMQGKENNRYNTDVNAAKVQNQIGQANRVAQDQFSNKLASALGLYGIDEKTGQTYIKDPNDLAVAEIIAQKPEYQNIPNDNIRINKIKNEFETFQRDKQEFKNYFKRPNPILNPNEYDKKLREMKPRMKLFDQYNQRNIGIEYLAGPGPAKPDPNNPYAPLQKDEDYGGWSESEIAKGTNPLDKNIENKLNKLPGMTKGIALTNFPSEKSQKIREDAANKWKNTLAEIIKPGIRDENTGFLEPGVSLINIQNKAIEKHVNPRELSNWVNELVEDGIIKLDEYQKIEQSLIGEGPGRTKSVYEYMMGK